MIAFSVVMLLMLALCIVAAVKDWFPHEPPR